MQAFLSNWGCLGAPRLRHARNEWWCGGGRLKNANPDVPVALLSSDECLPAVGPPAVDCLVPGSEPTINFLGKIEYWLSLRSLFQPFGVALVPEGA